MADKCFCHLNGYKVKDAEARQQFDDFINNVYHVDLSNIADEQNKVRTEITENKNEINSEMTSFKEEMNTFKDTLWSTYTEDLSNVANELNIVKNNDVELKARMDDNDFNTKAMYHYFENNLDVFVTENFETVNDIDETKDDGTYVITNNYDSVNHRIVIPSGNIKFIRSKSVIVSSNSKKLFISIDKEGSGSIETYFSSDGGVTFNQVTQDTLVDCSQGKNLVIQLKMTGEIILKNVCWGVRF